jgi:hypothetical protein
VVRRGGRPGTTCPRSVECPLCHAGPGSPCRRPSGHRASRLHARAHRARREQRPPGCRRREPTRAGGVMGLMDVTVRSHGGGGSIGMAAVEKTSATGNARSVRSTRLTATGASREALRSTGTDARGAARSSRTRSWTCERVSRSTRARTHPILTTPTEEVDDGNEGEDEGPAGTEPQRESREGARAPAPGQILAKFDEEPPEGKKQRSGARATWREVLDAPLGNVSYHIRELAKLGFLKIARTGVAAWRRRALLRQGGAGSGTGSCAPRGGGTARRAPQLRRQPQGLPANTKVGILVDGEELHVTTGETEATSRRRRSRRIGARNGSE